MKRFRVFALSALLAASGACKKPDDKGGDEPAKGGDVAAKTDEAVKAGEQAVADGTHAAAKAAEEVAADVADKVDTAKAALKDGEPLTGAQYEALILAHASCEVKDYAIDPSCPAVKAMQEAMNGRQLAKDALGGGADLGKKLITHESPAVRIKAAGLMASFLGTEGSSQDAIVEAAQQEQHPGVLKAMIRTVANDGARNPKVAALLLASSKHADTTVRTQAVYALSSTWNKEMPGAVERLAEMAELDPDPKTRQAACEYGGKLGDDKMYKTYAKLLKDTSDPDLWGACFEGLVEMWCSYPFFENRSEKAYKLTLELFERKPRTEAIPPWQVFTDLQYLAATDHDKAVAFRAEAKWFKAGELIKALSEVIKDKDAGWMARKFSVETIAVHGASKKQLEALRKPFGETPSFDEKNIAEALDKAIAEAK